MNKFEALDIADALGVGKCPKCGVVSSNPKEHCKGVLNE